MHGKLGVGGGRGWAGSSLSAAVSISYGRDLWGQGRKLCPVFALTQERSNVCKGVYRGQTRRRKGLWQGQAPLEIQSGGAQASEVRLLAPSL